MSPSDFDLTHQNQSIESKIVASLERLSMAFNVLLWNESKEHSLSPIQIKILIFLLNHSPEKRKVGYLANEFNMTKATISDTIKTLTHKKFITKQYEASDSRSYIIHLTESGKEIAQVTSMFSKKIHDPIDHLTPDNKKILLENLLLVIGQLNRSGIITIQRMCATCHYYEHDGKEQHFCRLLNQSLKITDLRIDCPEHKI
jgi:DNA-binding MarR family transcriptional regulator